jgi:riboflavin kinase/FMN adenylyltransferase
MQVHTDISSLPSFKNAVITVGTFDGVHKGHQHLIHRIKALASAIDGESVLITFDPHPRAIVFPDDQSLRILSIPEEKIELLHQLSVDHLVVAPFTKAFSQLPACDYVERFLVGYFNPAIIAIGYNHQFGHHRDGNIELLRKLSSTYHFKVEEITKQLVDDIEVSSTRIRIALQEGDVKTARHLLGHYYSLQGPVVQGNQLGRKLGYPTANIAVEDSFKLIPADGVYVIQARLKQEVLHGVASIGFRPTVNGTNRTVEAFLFDYDTTLYGEILKIEFMEWLRPEVKFETVDLMIAAIDNDVAQARAILAKK